MTSGAGPVVRDARDWWDEAYVGAAVARGQVVVAEADGQLVGVGQRGRSGADHVVYKLYVDPQHRFRGLGPRLLDALIRQLPADADRLFIVRFAANGRAGAFYEREGFAVERVGPGSAGDPALGAGAARPTSGSAVTSHRSGLGSGPGSAPGEDEESACRSD